MVKQDLNVIEVEVDDPHNRCLFFGPLQRRIRGRFDLNRVAEPCARMKANEWPRPLPGQRLVLDMAAAEASLVEPLRDDEPAVDRERIERSGFRLPPRAEVFKAVNVPTWLHWIKRAIESGNVRLIRGQLPETIDGVPKRNFYSAAAVDPIDRLTAAIESQTTMFGRLLEQLLKK